MISRFVASALFCISLTGAVFGFQATKPATDESAGHSAVASSSEPKLAVVSSVDLPSEIAQDLGPPLRCDHEGNLYLNGEKFAMSGFRKFNPKGERVATFDPNPDSKVKAKHSLTFALHEGERYALVYSDDTIRYIFVYGSDGKYNLL